MRRLLTVFIDIIFPPSPEEKLLREAQGKTIKTLYRPGTFQKIEYICRYSEPIIKNAIVENKFHHNKLAAEILGKILEEWISKQPSSTIYIPIPLGKQRLRQRGHNQVETILQSTNSKLRVNNNLLRRITNTLPQSHLKKEDRQKNIQGVFMFTGKMSYISSGTKVVLVDDVVTTGATMIEARAALAPHLPPGVTLTCLAIAH